MSEKDELEKIEKRKKEWHNGRLKQSLDKLGRKESPNRFFTPADIKGHDFLEKVGFPGEYPFTAGLYPTSVPEKADPGVIPFGKYSGYGTPEDTRDYYREMIALGRKEAPYLAFDLPTQLGLDPDHPMARGEVGISGVAVNTLRDFEIVYEPFTGELELDKIYSAWVINAPADIILAMYVALAEKRGIPLNKLRCNPQNDILKEYVSRGLYIFPPKPSMRLIRDSLTYCVNYMPLSKPLSPGGHHIRTAGATGPQALAFLCVFASAYVQLGVEAGLTPDDVISRFQFYGLSGSMDFFGEIALHRAARRMWAKIARDRLKAKDPRNWLFTTKMGATAGSVATTVQRPLNNLIRGVIGGVASALSGGGAAAGYPYDEPLGLGHSLEAQQLTKDAARIIEHESRLCEVIDPLAGSYYVESLTDEMEAEAWEIVNRIDSMGGAVAAVENGYIQREIAMSAYKHQHEIETGQRAVVGVNKFVGHELEVATSRLVANPYDPKKREAAEAKRIAVVARAKKERDSSKVEATLKQLRLAAKDEKENLLPPILDAVKANATMGEMCDVLRDVFGVYEEPKL